MIDVTNETIVRFRDLPAWSKENLGRRIHPSTFQRWRLRGARGVKLDTVLIGGDRCTSEEKLASFFAACTTAADGQSCVVEPTVSDTRAMRDAEAYLASQGI